jgi:DNA modification methylase
MLYNENCLDTMARMTFGCIKLTISSPPYDKLRIYNGFSFDFNRVSSELFRITEEGGVLVWIVGDQVIKGSETGSSFKQALRFIEVGFKLHDTMIWDKKDVFGTAGNPATRYQQAFEYIFVFVKGKIKTFNPIMLPVVQKGKVWSGTTRRDRRSGIQTDCLTVKRDIKNKSEKIVNNIFTYPVGFNKTSKDKIAFKHPAIFPDKLAEDNILTWSNPGEIVYDPFMGSGTTAKMAILNGRRFVGSEISAEYCDIANERISKAKIDYHADIL